MKYLEPVTQVNSPEQLYLLFTEIFPEMVPEVQLWFPLGEFTNLNRWIDIYFEDGMRLRFGIRREAETEEWHCAPVYMIPSYMQDEMDESIYDFTPAVDVDMINSLEDLAGVFCGMFPKYRDQVTGLQEWITMGTVFRGVRITLADGKHVAFNLLKDNGIWSARFPMLLPRPD